MSLDPIAMIRGDQVFSASSISFVSPRTNSSLCLFFIGNILVIMRNRCIMYLIRTIPDPIELSYSMLEQFFFHRFSQIANYLFYIIMFIILLFSFFLWQFLFTPDHTLSCIRLLLYFFPFSKEHQITKCMYNELRLSTLCFKILHKY